MLSPQKVVGRWPSDHVDLIDLNTVNLVASTNLMRVSHDRRENLWRGIVCHSSKRELRAGIIDDFRSECVRSRDESNPLPSLLSLRAIGSELGT